MDDAFGSALLRLKEQTGLHADKDVAELLGMSVKAFSARKTRGAFPEDKLFALVSRRPDLAVDATYVLTGERVGQRDRTVLDAMYVQTAKVIGDVPEGEPVPDIVMSASRAARDHTRCLKKRAQLNGLAESIDEAGLDLLIKMAERLT